MGSTTTITINRRRLFRQTIKMLNRNSLNSNTISLIPSFNKTSSFASINHNDSVILQTTIIYNTNPLHFLTLSLFFLPLAIITATLIQLLIFSTDDVTTIAVIISTITGVALITYSTHQAIGRTLLTFSSTFESLSSSFTPLLSTFVAGLIKLTFISIVISTLLGLGFHFGKIRVSCYVAVVSLLYTVTWGLAPSIAVLESRYGFESLSESLKNQSVRLWFDFFKLVAFTIYVTGAILWSCAFLKKKDSMPSGVVVMLVCVIYLHASFIMVHYVVSTIVLYVRAKGVLGGDVVVKTAMHVSREDRRRVPMLGWFSYVMVIYSLFC
ncbi:hypothetical protein CTI12_AA588300 [Artemisia annua]|uniref:Uncharacterized protein n=1 Tax=Artemisia annua TaxID=35608 RepID=A0A2U1KLS5_ARTAN|nr:hypothetical protein CTI12_AA588300 [Artemisia annua]